MLKSKKDPGNSLRKASVLALSDKPIQIRETVGGTDAADFFKIDLKTRSSLNLGNPRGNTNIALLNGNGKLLRMLRDAKNRGRSIAPLTLEAGTYFLKINGQKNGAGKGQGKKMGYQLRLIATDLPPITPPVSQPQPQPPLPSNSAPRLTTNTGFTATKGTAFSLNADILKVSDAEQSADKLVYTLTALPQNGMLQLNGETLKPGSFFTQADIDSGKLNYKGLPWRVNLTDNTTPDISPAIDKNMTAWVGQKPNSPAGQIYLNDGNSTRAINDSDNVIPQLSIQLSGSKVYWLGQGPSGLKIYTNEGEGIRSIPGSDKLQPLGSKPFQVSGSTVGWTGPDSNNQPGFYLYDGTATKLVTSDKDALSSIQISGSNAIWFSQPAGKTAPEIFFYNGSETKALTDDQKADLFPVISGKNAAWFTVEEGAPPKITYFDGSSSREVPGSSGVQPSPVGMKLSGDKLVWLSQDSQSNAMKLSLYDGNTTIDIPDSDTLQPAGQEAFFTSGSNVIWVGKDATTNLLNLYLYDGSNTRILDNDFQPGGGSSFGAIADFNVVWNTNVDGDPEIYFSNAATQDSFGFTVADGAGGNTEGKVNLNFAAVTLPPPPPPAP
jgi:hypothetical protein